MCSAPNRHIQPLRSSAPPHRPWPLPQTPLGPSSFLHTTLQLVSLWANVLGGVFPLLSARFGFNPAVTSAPLMTTVVDSSGLIIYFYIAKVVMAW